MKKKEMVLYGVSCALVFFGSVPSAGQKVCQDYSVGSDRPDRNTIYINTTYFPNTRLSYYWSSTSHSYFPYYGWAMYFHFGKDDWRYKNTAHYVRAVRYGQ